MSTAPGTTATQPQGPAASGPTGEGLPPTASSAAGSPGPLVAAIHHVAIIARDYATSRRFYAEVLGLPVIREVFRAERASWKCDLGLGAAQIELFSFPEPPPRPSRPEAAGLRHLAFRVARLEPAIARLEAFGVAVEAVRVDEHTGRRFTFFADPDGLPLELYEDDAEER